MAIILGLIIGSFLNACIYRVPRDISLVQPRRSLCPACNASLSWWENIPLISWLILRAKCHHCGTRISERYPLVEILSAAGAALSYIDYGLTWTALVVYAVSATMIVITFIDIDFRIIPNVITFPGMTIGLCLGIVSQYTEAFLPPVTQGSIDSLIGFVFGISIFYIIGIVYYAFTRRVGLGGGDIKFLGMTGAVLGWESVMPTVFLGSLLGGVVGVCLMVFKGGGRKTEIPFGPYLALGVLLYIFAHVQPFRIG